MKEEPGDSRAYAALLEQLRKTRSELEQLPSSHLKHLVVLTISISVILAMMARLIPLFLPPYLLLPFVLIPGWGLSRSEGERRAKLRAVRNQIRIVEERLLRGRT